MNWSECARFRYTHKHHEVFLSRVDKLSKLLPAGIGATSRLVMMFIRHTLGEHNNIRFLNDHPDYILEANSRTEDVVWCEKKFAEWQNPNKFAMDVDAWLKEVGPKPTPKAPTSSPSQSVPNTLPESPASTEDYVDPVHGKIGNVAIECVHGYDHCPICDAKDIKREPYDPPDDPHASLMSREVQERVIHQEANKVMDQCLKHLEARLQWRIPGGITLDASFRVDGPPQATADILYKIQQAVAKGTSDAINRHNQEQKRLHDSFPPSGQYTQSKPFFEGVYGEAVLAVKDANNKLLSGIAGSIPVGMLVGVDNNGMVVSLGDFKRGGLDLAAGVELVSLNDLKKMYQVKMPTFRDYFCQDLRIEFPRAYSYTAPKFNLKRNGVCNCTSCRNAVLKGESAPHMSKPDINLSGVSPGDEKGIIQRALRGYMEHLEKKAKQLVLGSSLLAPDNAHIEVAAPSIEGLFEKFCVGHVGVDPQTINMGKERKANSTLWQEFESWRKKVMGG